MSFGEEENIDGELFLTVVTNRSIQAVPFILHVLLNKFQITISKYQTSTKIPMTETIKDKNNWIRFVI